MAWKTSKYGHRYLYKNRRRGNRVITQYVGTGAVAELAARTEALYRAERQAELRAWQEELRCCAEIDAVVATVCSTIDQLVMAELLLAGCYRHQWEWRKRGVEGYTQKAA